MLPSSRALCEETGSVNPALVEPFGALPESLGAVREAASSHTMAHAAATYYPALDGVRAIAVVIVLLYHHGLLSAGWIGVDLFFALSGFLITGILRRSAAAKNYWAAFYIKRSTRILPPVLLLLLIVALERRPPAIGVLAYLFFAGNIVELTSSAIWQLAPLWSLAIEEHFYLFWPMAVRRVSRLALIRVAAAGLLAEPILRFAATHIISNMAGPQNRWNNPIFLLTPFRLDAMLCGALLALMVEGGRIPRWLKRWSLPSALALFALFFAMTHAVTSFRRTSDSALFNAFGYSLIAIAAGMTISYLVLNQNSIPARLLASRALVYVGGISYGIYLFQLPVQSLLQTILPPLNPITHAAVDLTATLALATLVFHFYEKPIIAWGRKTAGALRTA
jgi:peptidoglycan/LPS O-acetylase OafA/YrhL